MHLELAEEPDYYLQEDNYLMEEDESPYIFIPGAPGEEGIYVREDYFDDLPEDQYDEVMAYLEGAQQSLGLFGFGKKARARRVERRAVRQANKLERIAARGAAGTGLKGLFSGIAGIFGGGRAQAEPAPYTQLPAPTPFPVGATKKRNWTPIIIGGIALVVVGGMLLARRRRK